MSLINDMLKDLDGAPAGRRPVRRPAVHVKTSTWRAYLLPALAVICVCYWVMFEWNFFGILSDSAQEPALGESIPMDQSWLDQLQQAEAILVARARESAAVDAVEADVSTPAPMASGLPAATAAIGMQPDTQSQSQSLIQIRDTVYGESEPAARLHPTQRPFRQETDQTVVQRLLQSAELALATDRLTVPESNNAFYFYSTILLTDPAHETALQGIERVRQRYLALIDGAIGRHQPELARRYLAGAARAGVDRDTLAQRRASLNNSAYQAAEPGPTLQRVATGSPQRTDRNLARALQQKGLAGHEQQALQWVEDGAFITRTVLALTGLYSEMGATVRLQHLQERLAARQMDLRILPAAHMHWIARDTDLAIRQLQQTQFSDAAELARLRLLAGLLQETGAFEAASDTYATLVSMPGATSNDWLGLAVTLDAQNRHHAARQAYQNLAGQQLPGGDIANFVQQRLNDLALTRQR